MTPPDEATAAVVARILKKAGLDDTIQDVVRQEGAGNNQLFRVTTRSGVFAAKRYFRHAGDARDRLGAETLFLEYAARLDPRCTPLVHGTDAGAGVAVHEFLQGSAVRAGEVGADEVERAATFARALNTSAMREHGAVLPPASESCFSLSEHLATVESRLLRVQRIVPMDEADREVLELGGEMGAFWRELRSATLSRGEAAGLDPHAALATDARVVSPSDFGFHNAIRGDDGRLWFVDFEYAGWDDPAKLFGDFFAQLAVPVPAPFFRAFVQGANFWEDSEALWLRATLLRPVYRFKWCCIALNVFDPVAMARRSFSHPDADPRALKRSRLVAARTQLTDLRKDLLGVH